MDDESGEQFAGREILDRVSEGVLVLDRDCVYTYANTRALELLDRERTAVVGKPAAAIFPETGSHDASGCIETAFETEQERSHEWYDETRDEWLELRVYPDGTGATLFVTAITERKRREQTVERYEQIVENLPVAVGQNVNDEDDQFTYVNETMVEMFDAESRAEMKSHAVGDIYADPERRTEITRRLKDRSRVDGATAKFETFSGEQFWGALTATLETINDDEVFIGILEDIDERREHERQIRRLHDATQDFLQAESQAAVADETCWAAGEILGIQVSSVYLYDESVDALVPTAASERSHEVLAEPEALDAGIAWTAFETGQPQTGTATDAVYGQATPIQSEIAIPLGGHGVLVLASTTAEAFAPEDVTLAELLASNAGAVIGQIRREKRLYNREQELERADTLFENAQDAFFLVDVNEDNEYTLERVNPVFESLTGLSGEEIRGTPIDELFDKTALRDHYDECVRTRETVEFVEELSVPESESYWEARIAPVIVDGDVVQIAGSTRNITDRKSYERQLETQRDRLELLNEMVRHDIRNNLQVITSYAELLTDRVAETDREYVDRILTNAETAVELTRTARDISGTMLQTDTSTEPIPIRSVLLAQIDEIRTSYTNAVVTIEDQIPSVAVVADDMLSSVFRNVIKNAIQHNDKDVPEVSVSVNEGDDHVRVTVADNGPGVPDAQKTTIFGKGETGLESEGTGIGLYLVNTLIDRYGGDIQVHDNEPEGTIVTITFNRA